MPGSVRLGPSGLKLMTNLLRGEWEQVELADAGVKTTVSGVISGYMQWQLERGLKALNYVER
jgi:DNA repair protein RecO (recombination protein O)